MVDFNMIWGKTRNKSLKVVRGKTKKLKKKISNAKSKVIQSSWIGSYGSNYNKLYGRK